MASAGRCTSLTTASRSANCCDLRSFPPTSVRPPVYSRGANPTSSSEGELMRLLATTLLVMSCAVAGAAPQAGDIKDLQAYPTKISINGGDDAPQLLITATLNNGKPVDLSGDVTYDVANAKLARITSSGRII